MMGATVAGGKRGRMSRGDDEGPDQAGPCGCYEDVGLTLSEVRAMEGWSEGDPDTI